MKLKKPKTLKQTDFPNWFPSLDFQNRKLKSKRNQNLIKNIIFMSRQFNLTSYFLRIGTYFEQGIGGKESVVV